MELVNDNTDHKLGYVRALDAIKDAIDFANANFLDYVRGPLDNSGIFLIAPQRCARRMYIVEDIY